MSLIYEKFYKEVKDENGNIVDVKFNYADNFNYGYDVIDEIAKKSPDKKALIFRSRFGHERIFTFKDLSEKSNQMANYLTGLGLKKGDPVMLLLKRQYSFWVIMLALCKMGCVGIPTSHMVAAEDISMRIDKAKVKAVICLTDSAVADVVNNGIKGANADIIRVDIERDSDDALAMLEGVSTEFARVETNVSDDMLYYFTSGSMGEPKAVIHCYSYPLAHIFAARNWYGIEEDGIHFTLADSGWAKSAWGKLYGQWLMECTIMVFDYDKFYAHEILSIVEQYKVTSFCAPPTVYKYLVREDFTKLDLSNLKTAVTAGEHMPINIAETFFEKTGIRVREGYGQTESTLLVFDQIGKNAPAGSLGQFVPQYKMKIVDENLNLVKPGEIGELVIESDNGKCPIGIFTGYLFDPSVYEEVWEGGVYHTKDRVYSDENGNVFYVSRLDDVIKSSGYRIGPSEVEDILMRHEAVFECAVTPYPSKTRGYIVKATIVLREGFADADKNALKKEITQFVMDRTSPYKCPRMIEFTDELPKTTSGKICRRIIKERDCDNNVTL